VPRPRLLDQLRACLRQYGFPENSGFARKLILVSAPAGYGKTTALGQWLEDCDCPSAWLSLDAGDSDLGVFLTYLVGAIQTVFPDACPLTTSLLQIPQLPPREYLASTLTNELAELPDKLTLALDDFHLIEGEAVPRLVAAVLHQLPMQVCLAIATRHDPDLPLIRLRAGGEMVELRMADLCFSLDEAHAFLEQAVGTSLSDDDVEVLEARTEGWIVGLRLAALSLRGVKEPAAFAQAFRASGNSFVMEYLLDEVLSQQPLAIQHFLLRTSILERFCVPLCDEMFVQQDNHAILAELEQANLFLVPLDSEGYWYRYHHLFQELLAHRLQTQEPSAEIAALHIKASTWFADNKLIEEALVHTLAGGDEIGAARLVETNYRHAVNKGHWARLNRWMKRMPDSLVQQRPGLLLARCWCLHQEFKLAATVPVFEAAATYLETSAPDPDLDLDEEQRRTMLGEINGLRSQVYYFVGEFELGLRLAEQSLVQLSGAFPYGRSGALLYFALHLHVLGRGGEALDRLNETIRNEPMSSPFTMHLYNGLCYINRALADFPQLLLAGNDYLRAAKKADLPESIAFAHYQLGVVHYEWNELEMARHHFEAVINLRYHAHKLCYHSSLQGLALVYLAQGHPAKVKETIAVATEFVQSTESHLLLDSCISFQARMALLKDHLEIAERKSLAFNSDPPLGPMLMFEIPALTRAKVLVALATPDSLRQAGVLLDELFVHAKDTHYLWRQIEILALQSIVLAAQGYTEGALARLEQAVILAKPGRLIRTFVDQGESLADLLGQLAGQSIATAYLEKVLAAIDPETKRPSAAVDIQAGILSPSTRREDRFEIIEPMTDRELEVLALLGERLTNQEIAQRLVISPKTVKRHTSNIYQKLRVHDRRQAVVKARNLGIFPTA
jgi:LuxR family maltose regulon positive regulatory protein